MEAYEIGARIGLWIRQHKAALVATGALLAVAAAVAALLTLLLWI